MGFSANTYPEAWISRMKSQAELDEIARELNGRSRQTLGWKKPCEVLSQVVR